MWIGKRDRDSAEIFDAWVQMKATDLMYMYFEPKLLEDDEHSHIRLIECNPFCLCVV